MSNIIIPQYKYLGLILRSGNLTEVFQASKEVTRSKLHLGKSVCKMN